MDRNLKLQTLADAHEAWLVAPHPKIEGMANASRQPTDLGNYDRALACLAASAGDGEEDLKKLPVTLLQREPGLLGRQVREGARILSDRRGKNLASDKTLSNLVSCIRAIQKAIYQDLPKRRSVHDVIVTRPNKRKVRQPFSTKAWPDELTQDWAAFKVWKTANFLPGHEERYRKQRSRESSLKSYLCKLNQYIGFLVREQGRKTLTLEDLCQTDNFVAFLNWYLGADADGGYRGAKEAGVTLGTISQYLVAKGRLAETTADGKKIWEKFYALGRDALKLGAERGKLSSKKEIDDWKPWHLEELADAIWVSEPVHKSRPSNIRHLAQQVCRKRTALFFRLSVETPLRIRNWSNMRWGQNLYRNKKGRWVVHFKGDELKVGRRGVTTNVYKHEYSDATCAWIERWRQELRAWLGDDFETICLYVLPPSNFDSHRCSEQNLSTQIKGLCEEILGKHFNPHMVRHIVASHIVHEHGAGGIKLAAKLLGDSEDVILSTYYRPDTEETMRSYLAICASHKGKSLL